MRYIIELSFKLQLGSSYSHLHNLIIDMCENNEVVDYYFMTEAEGEGNKIYKNYCVASITVENRAQLDTIIYHIKRQKKIYIDCIHTDDSASRIKYVSSYYKKKMTKEGLERYALESDKISF